MNCVIAAAMCFCSVLCYAVRPFVSFANKITSLARFLLNGSFLIRLERLPFTVCDSLFDTIEKSCMQIIRC